MTQIVFNFTGNVTIHVSGTGASQFAPASAFVAEPAARGPLDKPFTSDPDAEDKAKLTELLNDTNYRFRKIETLADAIDRSEEDTESLLHVIGARQEQNNTELWGLKSRVGEARD